MQGGDAVWEGLRLGNGRIFKLHQHLDRLERSARALSFAEIPPREKIIEESMHARREQNARRCSYSPSRSRAVRNHFGYGSPVKSGRTDVHCAPAEHKAPVYAKTGLTLITSKIRRPSPEVLDDESITRTC